MSDEYVRCIMNDDKITLVEFSRFLIRYYTGGYPYQKLGQAFINNYHQCRTNMKQAASLHEILEDRKAAEMIIRDHVRDEV